MKVFKTSADMVKKLPKLFFFKKLSFDWPFFNLGGKVSLLGVLQNEAW